MIHYIQRSAFNKTYGHKAKEGPQFNSTRALKGEEIHYQIVLWSDENRTETVKFKDCSYLFTKIYHLNPIIVNFPHLPDDPHDDYLCEDSAIIPDCLTPISKMDTITIGPIPTILWISVYGIQTGEHQVKFQFETEQQCLITTFNLKIINHLLTNNQRSVCAAISPHSIAESINAPLYCNIFWEQLDAHFKLAAKHHIHDIITPMFSKEENTALDREPEQLIRIYVEKNTYEFRFDLLDTWLITGMRAGIKRFTFTALFPSMVHQKCPRIYAHQFGRKHPIFTENDHILSDEYIQFLCKLLRALIHHLDELNLKGKITFQLTEEVSFETKDIYLKCLNKIRRSLSAQEIIDYVEDYQFYSSENFPKAIVPLSKIEPFLALPIAPFTTFDIHSPGNISNQLIASSAVRTRALGLFFYRYDLSGLIYQHFNCYISPKTNKFFNPLLSADGDRSIPSGSTFLIYPDSKGPLPSMRLKLFCAALQDAAVLDLLENYISREQICKTIDIMMPVSPDRYPQSELSFMEFRNKIYDLLEKYAKEE